MIAILLISFLFFRSFPVYATPVPELLQRAGILTLSSDETAAFQPFSFYAGAAYCQPSTTMTWSCGAYCDGNAGFMPVASGGDGVVTQFWFVGYDPKLETVIVAHQGTKAKFILPLFIDFDIFRQPLDETLFPGIDPSISVHQGFQNEQALTATAVLAAVQTAMSQFNTTHITTVGHSLGAAVALLDSIYLRYYLPDNTQFRTVMFGLPRVGNKAFADFVDANLDVTHINNMQDIIPILPGQLLGFRHPSGEIHIQNSGDWVSCPGQDNPDPQCIVGAVPTIIDGSISFHDGPYNGVLMIC